MKKSKAFRKKLIKAVRKQIKEIERQGDGSSFGDYSPMEATGWLMDGVIDVVENDCKLSESDEQFYPTCDLYEEVVHEIVKEYYPDADFDD